MLTLIVPPSDTIRLWDEQNEVFYTKPPFKGGILKLEHSLISVSKWESKWCKPFIDSKKTNDEVYDYIRCMALNVNESDPIFDYLSTENHEAINKYLERPMTATTLPKERGTSKKIITSEVIYYWMLELGIPFECEKWNIKRLIVLIRVTELERNKGTKKVPQHDMISKYAEINARNRARFHSKG